MATRCASPAEASGGLLHLRRVASTLGMLALLGVLSGCVSLLHPGCGANRENWPDGPTLFLEIYIGSATNGIPRGSGVSLDATGRSAFVGDYTVWLLSSLAVCKQVPDRDVEQIREAWERALSSRAHTGGSPDEPRPYLAASFRPADEFPGQVEGPVSFIVKPSTPEKGSDLDEAVAVTLGVFIEVYGDRLVRELRYAGLDALVPTDSR